MFEQVFKNIDDILHKDAGCGSELDYVEQTSWILFLKYLDDLEKDKETAALLSGKTYEKISFVYACEADVLNMALFGKTAKQWRDDTSTGSASDKKGNIRDYANVSQLVCLVNLENLNAVFINEGFEQSVRLEKLNQIAISQMKILVKDNSTGLLTNSQLIKGKSE